MKTGTLAAVTVACLGAIGPALADDTSELAWQQPGYVMEVVIVTAPRPASFDVAEPSAPTWQRPERLGDGIAPRPRRFFVPPAAIAHPVESPRIENGNAAD